MNRMSVSLGVVCVLAGVGLPLSLVPLGLAAQDEEVTPPDGWVVRTDQGAHNVNAGTAKFWEMSPGWHLTTGPSAIFYHPEMSTSGDYRLESQTYLFDPEGQNEGFGVFVGGVELDGAAQSYTYFLIRADGSYLVKRREGDGTETITGWTKASAVIGWDERDEGAATAGNLLFVEATGDDLVFGVNGEEMYRMPRSDANADGVFGLRVNHALNLHITTLEVTNG